MIRYPLIILVAMACCTCSQQSRQPERLSAPLGPIITRIVSRDTTIIARAGRNGPVYSLHTNSGQLLAGGMTLAELRAEHPGLARRIQAMHAGSAFGGAWAGRD